MAAVSCQPEVITRRLGNSTALVTTETDWNNRSPYPIRVDTENTRCDIFQIDTEMPPGPLETGKDMGKPAMRVYPLGNMREYVLESTGSNIIRCHFVVATGHIYVARFKVYRNEDGTNRRVFAWTSEVIVDTRELRVQDSV